MPSELTATTPGSDAELHLSLSDQPTGENALQLTAGGRNVLSLSIRRASGETSTITATLGAVAANLEATGEEPRIRGTVGDAELSETDLSAVGGIEDVLPAVNLSQLSELPLDELARNLATEVENARSDPAWSQPADDCKDCNAECFLQYVSCLANCGDPGTIPGAVCWVRCMIAADKCQKACPCSAD